MPIATRCLAPGCRTITIGSFCIEHDAFVRDRDGASAPVPEPRSTPVHPGDAPDPGRRAADAIGAAGVEP